MKADLSQPLISVIVPAYNVAPWIEKCVDSILAQMYRNIEVIAVNDCSSDHTGAILDAIAAKDNRLKVVHQVTNVGVHASRSAGTAVAKGQFIGYVDGDDWVAPEMYESLLNVLVGDDADLAVCGALMASDTGDVCGSKVAFPKRCVYSDALLERFCRMQFGSGVLWNKLYRAELIRPWALTQLEREVDASEDYIVNVGVFASARRLVTIPESLYFYHTRPQSGSRKNPGVGNFLRLIRAYVVCLEIYSCHVGEMGCNNIDRLYAFQFRYAAYWVDPRTDWAPFVGELSRILLRLAQVHPSGIYTLIHAFDNQQYNQELGVRQAVRKVATAVKELARVLSRTAVMRQRGTVQRPPAKRPHSQATRTEIPSLHAIKEGGPNNDETGVKPSSVSEE